MKRDKILTVLRELHNVTGARVSLHEASFEEIAAYPPEALPFCRHIHAKGGELELCRECDRLAFTEAMKRGESVIYKCRYGLTESVSPLYNFGALSGFLMMGQIADGEREASFAKALAKERLGEICKDDIPTVAVNLTRSYAKIMEICAGYLTLSGAVEPKRLSIATGAKRYILDNFRKKILIKDICREQNCSKSTLLNAFMREYGKTVNEYITEIRLGEAARLTAMTDMTFYEIAAAVGFSDQSYFSKVFAAKYGIPPGKYRKLNKI